uniref:Solute carrier family 25 member 17 n=1 Tax=Astyanax mexicanus TaxID=7994 RepID=A0A8B9L4Z9_ASTMX
MFYWFLFDFAECLCIEAGFRVVVSAAKGAVNVLLTTPMWVVNTRLKLQGAKFRNEELHQTHYKGIFDAFSQIIANEGVGTLWNGTLPSLVLVFNPAVQFMFYEAMKRKAGRGGRRVSSLLFYKCYLFKVRMTNLCHCVSLFQGTPRSLSLFLSLFSRRNGVIGLYKGLEAKLLQTVLTAALMFVVYEKIAAVTFRMMGINKKLKH